MSEVSYGLKQNKVWLFILTLFILPVLTISYSEDKSFFFIEKRLLLLILPIILTTIKLSRRQVECVLYSFVLACVIASTYSLLFAHNNHKPASSELTFDAIGISHVYFGIYLCLSIFILIDKLDGFTVRSSFSNFVSVFIALFLLMILFILGSRMAIISLLLIAILFFIRFVVKTKRWLLSFSMILTAVCIFFAVMYFSDNSRNRILFLFDRENYQVGDNFWNNIGSRLSSFKCIFPTFRASPFLGTGLGDVQGDLDRCYNDSGFLSLVGMNAHNQYLQFLLSAGVIGLISFLSFLAYSFFSAFKEKNFLLLSFLLLFILCGLTESLLERQYGISFFAFFYFFLRLKPSESKTNNK